MKIFVNARFLTQPVSGVQRYGIECSRQIKKFAPDAVFLCSNNILYNDIAKELNVKIIGVNKGHLWEQVDLPFFLAKQKHPPLLNLANTAPLFYSNNYVTIHDLAFYHHPEWNSKAFSAWYNILIPRLAYKSRHIFTVSEAMKAEIVNHYHVPSFKITVTGNGISQTMLQDDPMHEYPKEKIILSVGSFNTRKNHQMLVKAFVESELKNEYQLVIVGDKSRVFAESNLDEGALAANNIKVYSKFTEQQLIEMYKKAEIVVSLSQYEGFGIPLLEGLFYNCKIVCSDIPVYREVYGNNAIFCQPNNTNEVIKALTHAATTRADKNDEERLNLFKRYSYLNAAQAMLKNIERA